MSAATSLAIADKFSTRGFKISFTTFGCVSRELEETPAFVYTAHREYTSHGICIQVDLRRVLILWDMLISCPVSYDGFKNKEWEK